MPLSSTPDLTTSLSPRSWPPENSRSGHGATAPPSSSQLQTQRDLSANAQRPRRSKIPQPQLGNPVVAAVRDDLDTQSLKRELRPQPNHVVSGSIKIYHRLPSASGLMRQIPPEFDAHSAWSFGARRMGWTPNPFREPLTSRWPLSARPYRPVHLRPELASDLPHVFARRIERPCSRELRHYYGQLIAASRGSGRGDVLRAKSGWGPTERRKLQSLQPSLT